MALLRTLMQRFCPRIAERLEAQRIVLESFVIDWILTVFSKSLPLETATRLWDIFLFEGEVFLFRSIIGLLRYFARQIMSNDFEGNMHLLTHLPEDEIDAEQLIKMIANVSLSSREYEKMRSAHLGSETAVLGHRGSEDD